MTLGQVDNRDLVRDVQVANQAVSTTLTRGKLVYLDGANGYKVVPTTGVVASRARFPINIGPEGQTSSAVLGNKKLETVKGGAIVHGLCDLAISVGAYVQLSDNVAGAFQAESLDTTTAASLATDLNRRVARFVGKEGSGKGTTLPPLDAADTDIGVFVLL